MQRWPKINEETGEQSSAEGDGSGEVAGCTTIQAAQAQGNWTRTVPASMLEFAGLSNPCRSASSLR